MNDEQFQNVRYLLERINDKRLELHTMVESSSMDNDEYEDFNRLYDELVQLAYQLELELILN